MIKEATQFSISHILGKDPTSKELVYGIPPYQREYTWGRDNWESLYNDIADAEDGYFLGSVICIDEQLDSTIESIKHLQVIDGQQRLTTISILVAALYQSLNEIFKHDKEQKLEVLDDDELNDKWRTLKSMLRFQSKGIKTNRLSLSIQKQNDQDYRYLIDYVLERSETEPEYFKRRAIYRGFKYFLDKFNEIDATGQRVYQKSDLFQFFDRLTAAILVKISVNDAASAFVLFESINNRGVPLTPIDLIKNLFISTLVGQNSQISAEHVNEKWQFVIANVASYEDQVRFLRHFYHAYQYVDHRVNLAKYSKATKSNIIYIYSDLIKRDPDFILKQLIEKSKIYKFLSQPELLKPDDHLFKYKEQLIALGRVQSVPANALLLLLLEQYPTQDFSAFLSYLENWFIRRHLTNTPATGKLDQLFLDLSQKVTEAKQFEQASLIEILNKAIKKTSDAEFINALMEMPIYDENKEAARSLLVKLEKLQQTKENSIDFWKKTDKGRLVWSIEHVLPQEPKSDSDWLQHYTPEQHQQWLHTLGNLTLTCYNGTLSNGEFIQKCAAKDADGKDVGLQSGILSLNQDFQQIEQSKTWTEQALQARGQRLSEKFSALFQELELH